MGLGLDTRVRLSHGGDIPILGLGVWNLHGSTAVQAIGHALGIGYRLIDTAAMYGNEREVGEAVRAVGLPRDDVFVTTKLWNSDHGYEPALEAFAESQERLGLGPVDLYLIHWPAPRRRAESWRALEHLLKEGECRAIGVSNYTVRHLEELLAQSSVVPAVNQVEMHPFVYDPELLAYCKGKGIVVEAYSPLTRGNRLRDATVAAVAMKVARTPAQVLLRWGLQHGLVSIPKSARSERIEENARVFDFELPAEDMATLDGLREGYHASWDPTDAP